MAGTKLDGAGTQKMATIEEALAQVQRIHGLVEQMALAVKQQTSGQVFAMQVRRAATTLVGLLKPQFGLIADQVVALNLIAGRGGSEQTKVRALREAVAMLRQQLEIAESQVKEKHSVAVELSPE